MNGLSGGVKNTRGLNGDTGSQVAKSVAANSGTTIIHTVTAGKAFYLDSVALSHDGFGTGTCNLFIRNGSDVLTVELLWLCSAANVIRDRQNQYKYPIKITAGYDICLGVGGVTAHACITGWEEDV